MTIKRGIRGRRGGVCDPEVGWIGYIVPMPEAFMRHLKENKNYDITACGIALDSLLVGASGKLASYSRSEIRQSM